MAGKSSALGAISSIMTGQINPYSDIKQKHMSRLVHSGTSSGFIELKDEKTDLSAKIEWPGKYSASSNHRLISPIVAGFKSIVDLNSPERVKYIVEMMKAVPTNPDLILAMKDAKIYPTSHTVGTDPAFQKLWQDIEINGWDVVYKKCREKGTKFKGQWELITGINYGSNICEEYEPDNFSEDLKKIHRETLIKNRDQAQEWCDAASKDIVLSEAEKDRLEKSAKELPKLLKRKKAITIEEKTANDSIAELNKKKSESENRGLICPSCHAKLTLSNGTLKTIPEKENLILFDYDSGIKSLQLKLNNLLRESGELNNKIKIAEQAKKELSDLKTDKAEYDLDEVSEKLAIAIDKLEAYDKYHQAHDIAKKISVNLKVQTILSPKGLRLTILQNRLKMLNKTLKFLCGMADWQLVEFNEDCDIIANGVPYHKVLLSRSEQFRVKLLLQLVCAMGEANIDKLKANFVVLDNIDILMKTERNQLLKILKFLVEGVKKYKFIIGVAYDKKEEIADFSKFIAGGKSYWIEDGIINN
jgi:hypothetical protein